VGFVGDLLVPIIMRSVIFFGWIAGCSTQHSFLGELLVSRGSVGVRRCVCEGFRVFR
jgi:hypothetical protein